MFSYETHDGGVKAFTGKQAGVDIEYRLGTGGKRWGFTSEGVAYDANDEFFRKYATQCLNREDAKLSRDLWTAALRESNATFKTETLPALAEVS